MRPETTFLTSGELQEALGNDLDDDAMDDLQRFRDRVMDRFQDHVDALAAMEDIWGREWTRLFLRIWVVEGAGDRVSSPILLERESVEETVFDAFVMLAVELIREDPPDSDLVRPGYRRIEALATLLTVAALEKSEADASDLLETVRNRSDRIKMWRKVDELQENWDGEEPLVQWVEGR